MIKKISPSIMCADFLKLEKYIEDFEKCNVDLIHVDIMDGNFVPNFTLGTDFVKRLKSITKIPMDIHLMIEKPETKIDWFDFGEGNYVSVHYEATRHLNKTISMIKNKGAKAMVALNPATPINVLESILDDIDAVLIMTVNPGFAGQKLVESTLKKIKNLRNFLDKEGYENIEIEVDGNVSFENAKLMNEAGANIFVCGTSSIFSQTGSIIENINSFRSILV